MSTLSFRPLTGMISNPPGVSVLAFAEHCVVEAGNTRILELAMSRPEVLAILDEVVVTVQGKDAVRTTRMSVAQARAFAEGAAVAGPGGARINIGPIVVVVFEQHRELWLEARRQAQAEAKPG